MNANNVITAARRKYCHSCGPQLADRYRRRWPVVALVFVALFGAACGGSASSGPVDMRFDFSTCKNALPVATDPDGSHVGCRNGAYEIGVNTRRSPEIGRAIFGPPQPRVSMTAHVAAPPLQSTQGVGCWRDPAHGYLFMTATDGSFAILRSSEPGIGTPAKLAIGWDPGAAYREEGTTLDASCSAIAGGTHLTLRVGGRPVAQVTDHAGLRSFTRAGFVVFDVSDSPAKVQFDNLHIATPKPPAASSDWIASPDRLLFDTFRTGRKWFTGADGGVAGHVSGGRYVLSVTHGNQAVESTTQLSRAVDSLYVVTSMRVAGRGDQAGGVTCYVGSQGTAGWAFVVQRDGHYSIRDVYDDRELAGGDLPQPPSRAVRLGAFCEHWQDGITLGLDIAGVRVAQAVVASQSEALTQAGVYLFGSRGAHVSFDAIEAAEVGPPSTAASDSAP